MGRPLGVYNLKSDDYDDVTTIFFDLDERADLMQIKIGDGRGSMLAYNIPVVVDLDALKDRLVAQAQNLYLGDQVIYIRVGDLPKKPKEKSFIILENAKWEILKVEEETGVYQISLGAALT